jgi:hypothetical protein
MFSDPATIRRGLKAEGELAQRAAAFAAQAFRADVLRMSKLMAPLTARAATARPRFAAITIVVIDLSQVEGDAGERPLVMNPGQRRNS